MGPQGYICDTSHIVGFTGGTGDATSTQEIDNFIVQEICCETLDVVSIDGISGAKGQIHVIDQESCIRCGSCYESCPTKFEAVQKIVGAPVPPPIPEDQRTIVRKAKKKGKEAR